MNTLISPESDRRVFCPHDLLWAADWQAVRPIEPMPSWADAEWIRQAPVVVRRERVAERNLIPVGVRGKTRGQRMGAYLDGAAVLTSKSPEMLATEAAWLRKDSQACLPALVALERLAPLMEAIGLPWGPTGSVGYALATGLPVLHQASDIDLVVRAPVMLSAKQVQQLRTAQESSTCRVDMQIDTGHGGFSLAEWVKSPGKVLLKTDIGPFITSDPWNRTGWLEASAKDLP